MTTWFWLAVGAAVLYGLHQVFTKFASTSISDGLGGFVVEGSAALTILVYLGWFHLSNPFPVSFPLPIIGALPVSASLALLGGLLAGLLYALLLFAPHLIRRSNLIRRQNRKIRDLEAQVAKLQPVMSAPVIPDRSTQNLEQIGRASCRERV